MILKAIGLMSGTSLDGIDAAYLETDGLDHLTFGPALTVPYDDDFRARLRAILNGNDLAAISEVERELTDRHAAAIIQLRAQAGVAQVDLIGFHGHTILHRPQERRTLQIGDGARLAALVQTDVVCDFRSADVAAGGQGAPLVPVYHRALAAATARPVAILNIGGVANVTWIGPDPEDLLAFDTGPGNAPLDDWMLSRTGRAIDLDGMAAGIGKVDRDFVAAFLAAPYFSRPAPKSLDRDDFRSWTPRHLGTEDGAATLVACIAGAVAAGVALFPEPAQLWLVTGGGRHNPALMKALAACLGVPIQPVDHLGWDGDALEAQAFAYLAVRSLKGFPLSFSGTTGAPHALSGGRLHRVVKPI